jgi:hypothetical protein
MSFAFEGVPAIIEGIDGPYFDCRQTGVLTVIIEDVLYLAPFFSTKIPGKSQHDLSDADQPFLNGLYDTQDPQLWAGSHKDHLCFL